MVYGTVPGVNPCGNAAEMYFSQVRARLGLGSGLGLGLGSGLG